MKIPRDPKWKMTRNLATHRRNITEALMAISEGKIKLESDLIKIHLTFMARCGKETIVVVPWMGHANYCLNVEDTSKILEAFNESEIAVLFGKFEPLNFTLYDYRDLDQIPKDDIRNGDYGDHFMISAGNVEMTHNSLSLGLLF